MTNPSPKPKYRYATVQHREITIDRDFTVREIREDHVRTLLAALRTGGRLDRLLVWEDLRDPQRPRLVLLDGQHRLSAYHNHRQGKGALLPVPVRIVTCDELTAHRLTAQRNSKDKLPLSFAEKMNLAWRLVWLADAKLSKAEIVSDTGASRTTVHNMRRRRRAMIAAGKEPTGEWWRDAKDSPPCQPEETDVESKIKELAEVLKGPAEAMRRQPAAVKWAVLEVVFGTYEARQFAWHGLKAGEDEFDDDAPQIESIIAATGAEEDLGF